MLLKNLNDVAVDTLKFVIFNLNHEMNTFKMERGCIIGMQ